MGERHLVVFVVLLGDAVSNRSTKQSDIARGEPSDELGGPL